MTIDKKNIFVLGATRFDRSDQSTSYTIARLLARNNVVYYIDYPVTWKDYFKLRGSPIIDKRKPYFPLASDGLISTEMPNFKIIVTPLLLSINFLPEGKLYRTILKINEWYIRQRIKKVIKKFNIKNYIYINSFNFHYPGIADQLDPQLTVYHCVDPMIMPYDMKHGIISENELVRKSDLVICTSKTLSDAKRILNSNSHFIPNAGDIKHSSKALSETVLIHDYISALKQPVVGYVGTIERRMDYDLLRYVVEKNPEKAFVFAGPVAQEYVPEWFMNTDNIHLLGRIPYEELPSILKGFDIAIIPFKKDEVSSTIFPLKLFEYLGAGKPVIATDFNPDLENFTNGAVSFCNDKESFSRAVDAMVNTDNSIIRELGLIAAQENTWERRADQFEDLLISNLKALNSE